MESPKNSEKERKGVARIDSSFYDQTIAFVHRTHYPLPNDDENPANGPCKLLSFLGSSEQISDGLYTTEDFRVFALKLNNRLADIRKMIEQTGKPVVLSDQSSRRLVFRKPKDLDYVFFPVDLIGVLDFTQDMSTVQRNEPSIRKLHATLDDISISLQSGLNGCGKKPVVVVLDPFAYLGKRFGSFFDGAYEIDLGYFLSGRQSQ